MKKGKILILAFLGLCGSLFAQQKIGHINSNDLLLAMPERNTIETEIRAYATQLENQLLAMQKELETKYQEFQASQETMSESIRSVKLQEMNDLETRLKDFQATAQEDLTKKEKELSDPLVNKAKAAIEKVAKDNGYTYILDSGVGIILYMEDSDDITGLVKKELGLE